MINNKIVINKTIEYVKQTLKGDSTGHDWYHTQRVWKMAKYIAQKEKNVDLFVIELAALLHDIADWKFQGGDDTKSSQVSEIWLKKLDVDQQTINHVSEIAHHISYKGAKVKNEIETLEGKIVQDADRLDAMGAIGIARTFATGGKFGRPIYDPNVKPVLHTTFEQYKNSGNFSINHFYEKLLLLKDMMNTKTGKMLAQKRHKFMEQYLKEFFSEWDGKV
jgi:uncharacterized protein